MKTNHIKFPKVQRKIVSPYYVVVASPRQQSRGRKTEPKISTIEIRMYSTIKPTIRCKTIVLFIICCNKHTKAELTNLNLSLRWDVVIVGLSTPLLCPYPRTPPSTMHGWVANKILVTPKSTRCPSQHATWVFPIETTIVFKT